MELNEIYKRSMEKQKPMIKEIIIEIEDAIKAAFDAVIETNPTAYVLLVGRADIVPELKGITKTTCVIDYQMDRYNDKTREGFYLRYMNRRYNSDGFHYEGEEGIDDLFVEMMIYSHLWDSHYYLKTLKRIAGIISDGKYLWNVSIPERGKWNFMQDIISQLKGNNLKLGDIIEKCYKSDIRNAFAHSLFDIDIDGRTITTQTNIGINKISFDRFQEMFLYSVIVMNKMQIMQETLHDKVASLSGPLTEVFETPEGVHVQIFSEMVEFRNKKFPEFRIQIVD